MNYPFLVMNRLFVFILPLLFAISSFTSQGNLDCRTDYTTLRRENFSYDSMNRLTRWMTGTASYHPTTGLMNGKSDLGSSVLNYGENGQPPHALTSISGTPSLIPPTEQSITYTDFKKVSQILENDNLLDITYGVSDQRIKTVLSNLSDSSGTLTRYYTGNYEEEIRDGNTRKIHYINGGNGLAAIYIQNAGKDTLYYAHTDYQGSLLALSLTNGTVIERYAYDPWGKRLNPLNWMQADTRKSFIIHRGYTMHEHLPEFNLINMNGRVYDPLVAQFFSPDPYVQMPGSWLNYNRYAYCYNNPLIYTDPDGELAWLIPIVVGGIINWAVNGADFTWEGLAYFGVGAFAGAATLVSAPLAPALAGAIAGAGNSLVSQGFSGGDGNSWTGNISWDNVGKDALMGAITGYLGSQLSGVIAPYIGKYVSNIGGPVVQDMVTNSVTSAATGFTLGAGMTAINGGDFEESMQAGWNSAKVGLATGGASGVVSGFQRARVEGVHWGTGKSLAIKESGLILRNVDDVIANPELLKGKSLNQVKGLLENSKGWTNDVMRRSTTNPNGGWVLREMNAVGTDFTGRIIQYHPETPRHFNGAPYWKISSGFGTVRFPANP